MLPTQGLFVVSPAEKTDHALCPSPKEDHRNTKQHTCHRYFCVCFSCGTLPGGLHGGGGMLHHLTGDSSLKATVSPQI